MNSGRFAVGVALIAVLAVGIAAIREFRADDTSEVGIVALTELAQAPPSSFPAIQDSAVRDPTKRAAPVTATVQVLEVIAHDDEAFTQGLEFSGSRLFESTGLIGRSSLREVDPETGAVIRSISVPGVFAEGLTIVGDEILQLTWTEEIAYRYDLETFELIDTHAYEGQGWGLCLDDDRLVMSDGSAALTFRDPTTFGALGSVIVTFNGAPVQRLNELECVDGMVWANIWLTPLVIEIDPVSGTVVTVIDASGLQPEGLGGDRQSVLNGIAHDDATETFLLTGKLWPTSYRVRIERP